MYEYEVEKPKILTDEGQRAFLRTRDHVNNCLKLSGAVSMGKAMSPPGSGVSMGDSWGMMACVDRLVELGEIREINYGDCAEQHRIFVSRDR